MKVLVTDKISEKSIQILKEEVIVETNYNLTPEELAQKIKDFDALIVRSGTQVTKEVIGAADNLKVIGRAGVGVDNIDIHAATQKGIIVLNAPEGNTIAAAEHTIAMMLSLSRNIPSASNSVKRNEWERKKFMGVEIKDKVIGIIGFGRIGREVAKRVRAFGMRVLVYDPYLSRETARSKGVELVDFEILLKTSDFITLHVPLTDKTRNMIDREEFAIMKPGIRIINCARGGIINEEALYEAIKQGIVAGAALDVFEIEPPTKDNRLLTLDNVIATPHLGASTREAQENVSLDVVKDVLRALKGEQVKNPINMPTIKDEDYEKIKPYMVLAEKMGKFYVQFKNGRINEIEMIYNGEISRFETKIITISALKGILSVFLQESINIVNAPVIAKERGIRIKETKSPEIENYNNLVTLKVKTDKTTGSVSGTIFAKNDPRIVKIDDFYIDLVPEGYVLLTSHRDQPGVVGRVGTILGENDINIATMQVGRKYPRGEAIMALTVDEIVSKDIIKQLEQVKGINKMHLVIF